MSAAAGQADGAVTAHAPFGAARALVTGADGFVGRHLVRRLLTDGWTVTAASLATPTDLAADDVLRGADWVAADVADAAQVGTLVERARPDFVVPLAAISHVPTAAGDPAAAWTVNTLGLVHLLGALAPARRAGTLAPRVLVVGSGECYGRRADAAPIGEDEPLAPRTVYAATKQAQEVAALQAWRTDGAHVVLARPFNHSGAGQAPSFLLPALCARVAAMAAAKAAGKAAGKATGKAIGNAAGRADGEATLRLGNTSPVRDFLHVSDVVDAYIALGHHGTPGTAYNVSSGTGRSVREVAHAILGRAGVEAALEEDPALVRPVDVPALVGDPTRLMTATGWRPRRSFDDLLDELLHAATH